MYPDDSLTLHTDLYQINMMQVYFDQGIHNKKAVFEVYFRQQPFNNGYAVFAGLERIVSYLEDLRFSDSDIAYLESLGYHGAFLDYLRNLTDCAGGRTSSPMSIGRNSSFEHRQLPDLGGDEGSSYSFSH